MQLGTELAMPCVHVLAEVQHFANHDYVYRYVCVYAMVCVFYIYIYMCMEIDVEAMNSFVS